MNKDREKPVFKMPLLVETGITFRVYCSLVPYPVWNRFQFPHGCDQAGEDGWITNTYFDTH